MNRKSNGVALILCFVSSMLYGSDKTVSVATLGDYPPHTFLVSGETEEKTLAPGENTSNFQGYSWDVLRESFHAMGYTIKLSVSPWPRAMSNLKVGGVDVLFPTGVNAGRLRIFNYSQEFVNEAKYLIYVRAGDAAIKWVGLESLRNLVIGVRRGFSYGDKWKAIDYVRQVDVNSTLQGFKMLEKERVDGFLGYENNWDYILKQQGWIHKYRKMPSFDSSKEYVAVLKSNPNGLTILQDFDSGKQKLIKSGRLAEIEKFWFGVNDS